MARNYGPAAQDGLLAMISVLSVMFLVLFVSCAYFLTLRSQIVAMDSYSLSELARLDREAEDRRNVAGYATEEPSELEYVPQYVDEDLFR